MNKNLIFRFLISAILLFSASSISYSAETKDADISYKLEIDNPQEGRIGVKAVFNKLSGSRLIISEQSFSEYMNIGDLKAKDLKGNILTISPTSGDTAGHDRMYGQKVYAIELKNTEPVQLEYTVKPGTLGKHGHRGYLDERFGLVAGKGIFLFPLDETNIQRITVEFKLPDGWEVACPWQKEGSLFVLERNQYKYPLNLRDILCEAVMGFGSFEMRQREINGFNIRIFTFSDWSHEHIHAICEQAFRLMKYQLDLLEINQKWDYTVIFVPNAHDKGRVFGESWSLGQGFEMEIPTIRSWELLSHRFHHVFNTYYPFGMYMIRKADEWFLEATASYYEIKALSKLGYYKLEDGLSRLKEGYDSQKKEYDAPLSSHYKKRFQTVEYLHYIKAPLVAYLMDEKIKKDTKDGKDLDGFLKHIYSIHGMKKSAVNLEQELKQFTGTDFSDFFKKYIDGIEPIELDLKK